MTSVTLARPANIPYAALYIDGERIMSSGYGFELELDDILIHLAMLVEGSIQLKIVTAKETNFDAEGNQLPRYETHLQVERVDYEVDGRKGSISPTMPAQR